MQHHRISDGGWMRGYIWAEAASLITWQNMRPSDLPLTLSLVMLQLEKASVLVTVNHPAVTHT